MNIQMFSCDGTVAGLPKGWYWREGIGAGHYGPTHGPFETERDALHDAGYEAAAGPEEGAR